MARIYFGTNALKVRPHEKIEVGVFLDTEGERINAVGGRVAYPDSVTVQHLLSGNSFISFWLTEPQETADGVVFEGVIPGGYLGSDLYLFSAIVEADIEGEVRISSADEKVLLHDGSGTPTETTSTNLTMTVADDAEGDVYVMPQDSIPPEPFTPTIVSDTALYDGAQSLLFTAEDKESGVSYYEVREYRPWTFFARHDWVRAESPYVLQDQELKSVIEVRAVDYAGNRETARLNPTHVPTSEALLLACGILFATAVIAVLFMKRRGGLWGKRYKKR